MNENQIALIIVAAGSSTRMGGQIKKEYLPLNKGTVLSQVALTFLKSKKISSIVVVTPKDGQTDSLNALYKDSEVKLLSEEQNVSITFIEGGSTRQKSVFNALCFLEKSNCKPEYVLIHDGARPFLSVSLVNRTIENTIKYKACVPSLTPTDTQKEIDENGFIKKHLVRKTLGAVQTPQGFSFTSILESHKKASLCEVEYTDDTEISDKYSSVKTFVFPGEPENIKITYKGDLEKTGTGKENKMFRTGLGYDKHLLVEGRKLIIGGIEIPYEKGEAGHSDGDAVLHAITDALLGASHLGDIGSYFPDTDPKYKDADSRKLLSFAWNDVKNAGWNLENLDVVILLQKPKFIPFREKVIHSIAETLGVQDDRIFVKAKTGEKIGDVGLGNCIEVYANCLLSK